MRVSVVINTYNRAKSLRDTLAGLRYQTHGEFEVLAVIGPCTDDTLAVCAEYPGVRVAHCPRVHLSESRNVGIDHAAGDIVAFIDDDAIPEPRWLEELVAAYDSPGVGGAGGLVYDHTGVTLQYKYSICDRTGGNSFGVTPPFDAYNTPGADPFVYLQGTNCSFRRVCLEEIGGFDEEFEYFLDEVEVCMRVIDRGYKLRPLAKAAVHHKYLASHLRNSRRVVFNPYAVVKNRHYFALQNGAATRPINDVFKALTEFVDAVQAGGETQFAQGDFTREQLEFYRERTERGVRDGLEKGLHQPRKFRPIAPRDESQFQQYPTIRPEGRRLTVCFLSQEYPPGDFGGIGRFTCDLAEGFASQGHEVHVVTRSPDMHRVDFENGVWLHRVVPGRGVPAHLRATAITPNLEVIAEAYHEVCRIHDRGPVDVVSAPLWLCEGLLCALDGRFPTVLTLMTSFKTVAGLHPSWQQSEHTRQLLALEGTTARAGKYLHAISAAILEKARKEHAVAATREMVVPLGIRDRSREVTSRRDPRDGKVRVLFVGRLERRKGVDLLLQAAANLARVYPEAEFLLAGKDTPNTETGATYREAFARLYAHEEAVRDRVKFLGLVDEADLYQLYADCDVFVLPSRYESFGLVLLEAMQFGKPVVGVAIGGMQEIVEHGGNGFLAKPDDAASLEECLRDLIGDSRLRDRFGKRSRELFEERFSAAIMTAATVRVYTEIAAQPAVKEPRAERLRRLVNAITGILRDVCGLPHGPALLAAQNLLTSKGNGFHFDFELTIDNLLQMEHGRFVEGLYVALLDRDATEEELLRQSQRLQAGRSRAELLDELAHSEEAKSAGLPTGWLARAKKAAANTPWPPPAVEEKKREEKAEPLPPGWRGKVRKAMRYLKRLVTLPWNFHKLFVTNMEFQPHLSWAIHNHNRELREALDRQGREFKLLLNQQAREIEARLGRQVDELRRELRNEGEAALPYPQRDQRAAG